MGSLELEIKSECYRLIEILLKNLKESEELTSELENLKKEYFRNMTN